MTCQISSSEVGKFLTLSSQKSIDYYIATLIYDHANGRFLQYTHFSYSKEIITSRKLKNCNSKSQVWGAGLLCNNFLLNLIAYYSKCNRKWHMSFEMFHKTCYHHTCPLQSPTSLDFIKNSNKILVFIALSFS